ncbi:MAG: hypothetical protein K8R90_11530 [Candidatus Cloacimonetes bacterium]|nr:hypothetical protein [Candidatus Cloacimonadota bacterium]
MAKGRSFAAKLAHELTTEGKVICPTCETEIRMVKLIRARKSKAGTWMPNYKFARVCKCNEADLMSGKE